METSFGLLFYLKKNKLEKTSEMPVYLRITVDGKLCEISTKENGTRIMEFWTGRLIGKTDYAKSFNAYLDILQQKVYEAKRRLIELDQTYSAEDKIINENSYKIIFKCTSLCGMDIKKIPLLQV